VTRVLLTGGGGFVGRHVATALRERGHEVLAPSSADFDLLAEGGPAAVVAATRPRALVHLAWYAEHGRFWDAAVNDDWTRATIALTEAFAAAGGERALLAGSCAEYVWDGSPCDERTTPLEPAHRYGRAKDAARRGAEAVAAEHRLSLAWGRIFFTFGPGEPAARIVPSIARAVLDGRPAEMTHGDQLRDWLYVEDLAAAFAALLESGVRGPVNVASGVGVALREIALAAGRAAGDETLVRPGALPARPGEPERIVAAVQRLREEVGWQPRIGIEEGLARTVAALRASGG
jgi:nucleoside-diphosphate-sugar epimerase